MKPIKLDHGNTSDLGSESELMSGAGRTKSGWSEGEFGKTWVAENPFNATRRQQVELIMQLVTHANPSRVLDLGYGPGLIGRLILSILSHVDYVGVDVSDDSFARAKAELEEFGARASLLRADFGEGLDSVEGKFDLVIAVQTLHHLDSDGKRRLFSIVRSKLENGGLFVISDRIEMTHTDLLGQYLCIENYFREQHDFARLPQDYSLADYRQRHVENDDLPDSIEFHLAEMRRVGFKADCLWQTGFRAIMVGR